MKYIDKEVIENILRKLWKTDDGGNPEHRICYNKALQEVQCEIDGLEVKEVKEDSTRKDLEEVIGQSFIYHENHGDDFRSDKQIETAYRYGFEDGVKYNKELTSSIIEDIEKQSIEMKEVDLDKKIKDYFDSQPIITKSKGVNYQLIPTGADIARHFFELGIKAAQKGE